MKQRNSRSGFAVGIESLEPRRLMTASGILVESGNYSPLRDYSQTGTLLHTSGAVPTVSKTGAGDGGSPGAIVVDASNNIQVFTGSFEPFLQRHNGPLTGGTDTWTTEATTVNTPGWSLVGRTFYGGLAAFGQYVFATDMSAGDDGGANGLIRFDAKNGYAPTRFAGGVDYSDVTLGLDGNLYGLVSPGGQPESGTVNVFNPTTLALVRTIKLTDTDDASVVADAQGNIYTGAFDGATNKINSAGKIVASVAIASTDLSISTDGKILSSAGNTVRVLDENLNILSGFTVDSPLGAPFVAWDTYQAPAAPTTATISGTVFGDTNADGKLSTGEAGLANVRVYIDVAKTGAYVSTDPSVLTGSTGTFTLPSQVAGTYRVREVAPTGDTITAPAAGYVDVALGATNVTGVTFGDAPPKASISGTVFNDANVDGKLTTGEKGIAGVRVYIDAGKTGAYVSTDVSVLTSSTGTFTLTSLAAGTYRIREVAPTGDVITTPAAGYVDVTVAATNVTNINFGDALATASVSGTVYVDFNSNGKKDTNDIGLGLWTLQLTYTSGLYVGKTVTATTAADGTFAFTGLTAGTYTLKCVPPVTGTTPTKPTGNSVSLTLAAGAVSAGNLFGEI